MASEPRIEDIEQRKQPLSGAANSEMGPREQWNEKNPATEAVIIKNLKTTDLTPREYRKTHARFYRLGHGSRLQPHLSELPPKGASVNHRHTTEAVIYIVSGHGHSVISWDGGKPERIDWEEGDMFSFPTWMWRNTDMQRFVEWLTRHNASTPTDTAQTSLHGLDIYSLNNSIGAVLDYLDRVDPTAAFTAREMYACFTPWERDPATYGRAAASGALAT
jgi:hypothetical protein